jgi:hypothetical protein
MNYGGITFRIYLIPSYLIFAVFLGSGLSAVRRWLTGLLSDQPRWLAGPLVAALAAVFLVLPLYPLWQNWAEVDQSDNVVFHDLAWSFVDQVKPGFALVEAESHYDELEAILYVAWVEKGWYSAQSVPPDSIEPWLGQRPVYAWYGDVDIPAGYIQEPVPGLPGMARILDSQ